MVSQKRMTKAMKALLKQFENTKVKVVEHGHLGEPPRSDQRIVVEGSYIKFLDDNHSLIGVIDMHCGRINDYTLEKPQYMFFISRVGAVQLNLKDFKDFKIIYSSLSRLTRISYSAFFDAVLVSDIEDALKLIPLNPNLSISTFPGVLQFAIQDNLLATFNSTGKVIVHLLTEGGKPLGVNNSVIFDNAGNWDEYVTLMTWKSKTELAVKLSTEKFRFATINV
jgi:hypothetical protein